MVQPRSSEPAWVPPAERQEKTSLLLPGEDQSLRVKVALGEDQAPQVKNPLAMTLVLAVAGAPEVDVDKAPGRARAEMGRRLPAEGLADPGVRQAKSRRVHSARAGVPQLQMTQAAARNRLQVGKEEGGDRAATMQQKSLVSRRRHLPAAAGRPGAGRSLPESRGRLLKRLLTRGREGLLAGGRRSRLRIKSRAGVLAPVVVAVQRRRLQRNLPIAPGAQRVPPKEAGRPAAGVLVRNPGREMEAAVRVAVRAAVQAAVQAGAVRGVRALHVAGNPLPARRLPARRRTWSEGSWSMPSSPRKSA